MTEATKDDVIQTDKLQDSLLEIIDLVQKLVNRTFLESSGGTLLKLVCYRPE